MLNVKFMNIQITRTHIRGEYCEGHLTIDGTRICDTLENANSRIPAGLYPITLAKCKQYSRKMPLLNPHPPCDLCKKLPFVCNNTTLPCYCPMLKPGNGVYARLDGSIIVGVYNCLNSIIHPKVVFDALSERIRKSISRGNQVLLTVVDPPPRTQP
jgi:hypothetical protein